MLVIRGQRVMLPDGERPASIHIQNGTIIEVAAHDETRAGAEIVEAGDFLVSSRVWSTRTFTSTSLAGPSGKAFDTATRAAAAGGVTTIVDMPLNSVPATTTVDGLGKSATPRTDRCHVDVAFWGGIVPGNESELDGLIDAGVRGFKCFLVPSGVDEFPAVAKQISVPRCRCSRTARFVSAAGPRRGSVPAANA